MNSPVACKQRILVKNLINVTMGSLVCFHKYIEFNRSRTTKCFKIPAASSVYGCEGLY